MKNVVVLSIHPAGQPSTVVGGNGSEYVPRFLANVCPKPIHMATVILENKPTKAPCKVVYAYNSRVTCVA